MRCAVQHICTRVMLATELRTCVADASLFQLATSSVMMWSNLPTYNKHEKRAMNPRCLCSFTALMYAWSPRKTTLIDHIIFVVRTSAKTYACKILCPCILFHKKLEDGGEYCTRPDILIENFDFGYESQNNTPPPPKLNWNFSLRLKNFHYMLLPSWTPGLGASF